MDPARLGRRLSRRVWEELPFEPNPSRGRSERRRVREALLESIELIVSEEKRRLGRPFLAKR